MLGSSAPGGLVLAFSIVAAVAQWLQHAPASLVRWGIWICAAVAVALLAGEILLAGRSQRATPSSLSTPRRGLA